MTDAVELDYDEMIQHPNTLSDDEKELLKRYLFTVAKSRSLTGKEKSALLTITVDHTTRVADFSNRRQDWYDDDGR